jgi:pSer/pThr/pTyr-binding forkhead associated (FHA) protein
MPDSHLNSMHLEMPRREEFRRARSMLFNACGELTRIQVEEESEDSDHGSRTMIHNLENQLPDNADYGLMDKEAVYPLRVGMNTIGRLPDNEVVLQDPYVSRRHCAILVHVNQKAELHDVASKNGTFLNGLKLAGPTPLNSGDEIRMCDRQLIFVAKPHIKGKPGDFAPTRSE